MSSQIWLIVVSQSRRRLLNIASVWVEGERLVRDSRVLSCMVTLRKEGSCWDSWLFREYSFLESEFEPILLLWSLLLLTAPSWCPEVSSFEPFRTCTFSDSLRYSSVVYVHADLLDSLHTSLSNMSSLRLCIESGLELNLSHLRASTFTSFGFLFSE